jgi:outer membrane protein with beta-barrel domain
MNPKFLRMTATAALLVAAMTATASAQTIGITAGATFNTLNGDDAEDVFGFESKTGFVGGAYLNLPLGGGSLSLEPAVLYTMKDADLPDFNTELSNEYIQIPVLLRYGFGAGGVKPSIFVGPAASFSVGCEFTGDVDGSCEDTGASEKSVQWDGIIGAGLSFGKFGVDVRYEFGLTDVYEDFDAKNGTFAILARYDLFGL